ncbi:MAG: transglycosylase domain-containing protein, partial [Nitriliruptoraceae bacterium]
MASPTRPRGRGNSSATSAKAGAPRRRRWWLALLVIPAVLLAAAGLLGFYLVSSSVPLPGDIDARSSIVFDIDGEEVGGLASETGREDVDLAELPSHVPDAVLAAEDRGFYDHRGISVTGIARALFTNVRAGEVQQGGSTITQQYIKNATQRPEQTYQRKVEEAALAIKLEQAYEKDEILGFYLNTIYWGRGTYGIEASARTFFGVSASELSVNQAATLAGIVAAPEAFDPLENPARADERRRFVLNGMVETGALSRAEADQLIDEGLPEVTEQRGLDRGPNAYYVDAVRRELAARPEFAQGELFRGLRIYTELDQSMQVAAQETIATAIADGPSDTGAIVSIDPQTGGVRALVGGPDIDQQPFNTAVRSIRQVGSTFKPFTLQAFIEAGRSPETRFAAPAEIEIDDAQEPIRNFAGSSFGEQTVRQATASSTNTVYVQMQEEVGREAVIDAARRAGLPRERAEEVFPTEREDGPTMNPLAGLTLGQSAFTPLELTSAYGTYAAEGFHARPRLVVRVEDTDGRAIFTPGPREDQAVDVQVARAVTDVLAQVVSSGSGTAAALDDRPAAGKTGTTNEGRDVWFAGYVPQLATTVWLGNLDNTPIEADNATGGGLAAPVWRTYMLRATEGLEVQGFTEPSLELEGGEPDVEDCPQGYEYADPPSEADEDGFFPDILLDIQDDEGRPCVEIKPELEPCPEGYAYGEEPDGPDEFGRTPDVLDEPVDFQGRRCVEVLEDPEPDEDENDD